MCNIFGEKEYFLKIASANLPYVKLYPKGQITL